MTVADIGIFGVNESNRKFIMQLKEKNFVVLVYDDSVLEMNGHTKYLGEDEKIIYVRSQKEFIEFLKLPRKILIFESSGENLGSLVTCLNERDIIIDGRQTNFRECKSKSNLFHQKNLLYVEIDFYEEDSDLSTELSFVLGGNIEAWEYIKDIFQGIAFKINNQKLHCEWVGSEGSCGFLKLMHTEYNNQGLQMICEAYSLMKDLLHMPEQEIFNIFLEWSYSDEESLLNDTFYLIKSDNIQSNFLNSKLINSSMAITSLDEFVPATVFAESIFFRKSQTSEFLQLLRDENFMPTAISFDGNKQEFLNDIKLTLIAGKIISYTQGLMIMNAVSKSHKWMLNIANIFEIWQGVNKKEKQMLKRIQQAYEEKDSLQMLLLNDFFHDEMLRCVDSWRKVVSCAVLKGIPIPMFTSALAFYDGIRTSYLPANLIQALRDYFGAHQYQLLENPEVSIHTKWSGK